MPTLGQFLNDYFFSLFDKRVVSASALENVRREQDRLNALAASGAMRTRIVSLASLLAPRQAVGFSKIRLGSTHDGGYVCLDDFEGIRTVFSLGIADNADWDAAIAERGIAVYQFDYSIETPPRPGPNLHFERKRIVPMQQNAEREESLTSLLQRYDVKNSASSILKIDIEHDEWEVFSTTSRDQLSKFSQIICEFHGFGRVDDTMWYERTFAVLGKLHLDFDVVHIHGNNWSPWVIVGNVPFPDVLEVTYANRVRYETRPSDETFPTRLDTPNDKNRADLFLGRFDFT